MCLTIFTLGLTVYLTLRSRKKMQWKWVTVSRKERRRYFPFETELNQFARFNYYFCYCERFAELSTLTPHRRHRFASVLIVRECFSIDEIRWCLLKIMDDFVDSMERIRCFDFHNSYYYKLIMIMQRKWI